MRGVGEHVHHAGSGAGVASFVDEQAGITGQGGGVAADIDDAFGGLPVFDRFAWIFNCRVAVLRDQLD